MHTKGSNNLCNIYMLPLTGLRRLDFGETNFVNSFVDQTNTYIIVELKYITSNVQTSNLFRFEFKRDGRSFAVFEVPTQLRDTLVKFREGKYSQFSSDAKLLIRSRSGLKYKMKRKDGKVVSDRELLVLDRDETLRAAMEQELLVKIDKEAELGSIPGEDNFMDLHLSRSLPVPMSETN